MVLWWCGRIQAAVVLALCLFMLAASVPGALAAPQSYIREEVAAGYSYNGTLSSPVSRNGYVEVDVGNTQDVLQYIRLTLSGTQGTNLQSVDAYRNVAASPNLPGDRTLIFVNTTNSTQDISYQITDSGLTPVISMRMDYANRLGGQEIIPGKNTFDFNVTLNSDRPLSGASVVMQTRLNTYGMNDSVSLTGANAASGTATLLDTDTDGTYDRVYWTGDLPAGDFTVTFTGNITPGINFDESLMHLSLDQGQSYSTHTQYQTFTGTSFANRFSRGPIREGIEMIQLGTWTARGFVKNIADSLSYISHGWDLYQLGNPSPVLTSSTPSVIGPGQTQYTGWYDTGTVADKPAYYSASFDWEIVWGTSTYTGTTTSLMDMPELYGMDAWADGAAVLQSNAQSGKSVMVNVTARHLGYSQVGVDSFRFNSTLPRLADGGGGAAAWTPSSIKVYYSNGSGIIDITASALVQSADSSSGDGFVYAEVTGLPSLLGHPMRQNDDVIISYMASTSPNSLTLSYTFHTNATLVTHSGTPVTRQADLVVTAPGVVAPVEPGGGGGGGGGGGPLPSPYADIVKESSDAYFTAANIVNVVVTAGVIDSGDKGVKDVKVLAYVPADSAIQDGSATLMILHAATGRWETLALDKDFSVTDRGLMDVAGTQYREYLIKLITPAGAISESTIDLHNGDKIAVSYKTTIPFGTSYLLTRIFGYSYYEDRIIFEDAYIPIRRELANLEKMQVEEGNWTQGDAVVGRPVSWTKSFRIYNPNNVSIEETEVTKVFQDSLSVNLDEIGAAKTNLSIRGGTEASVSWSARLKGNERKTYVIEAMTPPILETRREIDILESNSTSVRIIANLTIENFAKERYVNHSMIFPIRRQKIIMVSDPTAIIEDDGQNSVRIRMRTIAGLESSNLQIMYIETPPMLTTAVSALKYSCTDSANVTIYVVPSENELESYIETQVVGPEPNAITSHAEIIDMKGAKAYEEVRIPLRISLSTFPSGKYYIYTNFNRNFGTILSDRKEFYVDCPGRDIKSVSWIIVLAASCVIVSLLMIRVYKKRNYEKEVSELRKKVKDI